MKGCARQGLGNPPLCQAHVQQLYPDAQEFNDEDPVNVVLDRLMQEPRVQEAFSAVAGRVDAFAGFLGRIGERAFTGRPRAPRENQGDSPPPPWGRRKAPEPQRPTLSPQDAARRIMGFKPGQVLTLDQVKKKYRELAMKHHPDRGGDPAKMVAINRANDALTKELGG
jgi:hypothetical protein